MVERDEWHRSTVLTDWPICQRCVSYNRCTHVTRPLRHARPLRPARQPALPRRDDLRRGLGLGLERRRSPRRIIDRYLERGGNFIDTANVYTKGHSEKIIGDHIGRDRAQARPRRSSRRSSSATCIRGDPERRRRGPQVDRRRVRAVAAPAADRLHRSLLDARLGPATRRSRRRCARSTTWCAAGKVRYIGFSDTPAWKVAQAQTIGALPRLGAADRAADRVLAARAHGRGRAGPDGAGAGPRRHAVVAAARRRAVAASTRAQNAATHEGRPRRARDAATSTSAPTRSSTS